MSESENNNDLLLEFRRQLKGSFSEIFFSEEELVSIFDTAGDANDDYLRQEALLVGARLYPDSKALLARRGIFYNQTDAEAFSNFMEDHDDDDTPGLLQVLKTESFRGAGAEQVEKLLEDLFNTGDFNDDEFVIQFVQAVRNLEQPQWLINHFDELYKRVTYKPTLLYEIGIIAQDVPELRPLALRCLEELTDADPFTADFWSLSGYLHFLNDEREKSASAIDYALALDPNHLEALKGRMRLLDPEKNAAELADVLHRIINNKPDPELIEAALLIARNINRPDLVTEMLDMIPQSVSPSYLAVTSAISIRYPKLRELLSRAISWGVSELDDWRGLLEEAHASGNEEAYGLIQEMYQQAFGMPLEHEYITFMHLWEKKDYEQAISLFANANPLGTLRLSTHFYEGMILFITMLLRTGRQLDAEDVASALATSIDSGEPLPGTNIERIGARRIISYILELLTMDESVEFWEKFDPFDSPNYLF